MGWDFEGLMNTLESKWQRTGSEIKKEMIIENGVVGLRALKG